MTNFYDQIHIDTSSVTARTIFVDTLGVKATDFDIDELTQQTFFLNGREAATEFLSGWNFARYVETHRTSA